MEGEEEDDDEEWKMAKKAEGERRRRGLNLSALFWLFSLFSSLSVHHARLLSCLASSSYFAPINA